MMPHAERGRLGGAVTAAESPKKAKALRDLHASRRGVRHRPDTRDRETVLTDVIAALRNPMRGVRSIRAVAAHCRVSDRTVRRWLSGEDWPPPTQIRRMQQWLAATR
jgi:hypothetical protein